MKKERGLVIRLSKEGDIKDVTNLRAYVTDAAGSIIETASFDGWEAKLKTTKDQLHGSGKVYIGQQLPKEAPAPNETTLLAMNAYQAVLNTGANSSIDIARLPASLFIPLPWHFCHVKGNLSKTFIIDGHAKQLPVCHARVHICNVTPIFWPPIYLPPKLRIPDWVLEDLRDKFRYLERSIPKFPPKPGPDPGPIERVGLAKTSVRLSDLPLAKDTLQKKLISNGLQVLPDEVMQKLTSGSLQSVKQALIDHHELLYPYICLWPIFWPWFYWLDEEAVVTTDCNGHYDAWLFSFNNTNRNIYIWVEVQINGIWTTVYRPPVPCYVHWNYACGTDINISITDSRVHPCDCADDGPADAVWFRSIGSSASALHIEQNTASTTVLQGASLENGGCTDILYSQYISPFGGTLYFKLFCGANIFNANVTHYRWKRTRITDANQNPIPLVLQTTAILPGNIARPYLVKLSATHYETHALTLGAEGTGTDIAYRIPHQDISAETALPAADKLLNPEWSDVFFDSAVLDTTGLDDGIYEFKLELLRQEASGSFTIVPVAKPTYQVSEYNNIGSSQNAPDAYLHLNADAVPKALSLKVNVRIDNAHCNADIHDAMLVETGALSSKCGFIKYTNTGQHVQISYEASHPRNFARFSFDVIKGNNTEDTGVHASGYVLSGTSGFGLSGNVFSRNVTVAQLLGTCPGQAAFSENLHVASLATDGSYRLDEYDDNDVNAFALSNT